MNKKRGRSIQLLAAFLFLVLCASGYGQPTPPILREDLLQKIAQEVSGSICFEHIRFLSTLNRIWGSRDYHRAAQYCVDKCVEYGLKEAKIEKFSIKTGRESFWMHSTGGHVPWDLKRGEFRLVEPSPMLISHYENAPSAIAPMSRSSDVVAELVYVGRGDAVEDYEGKDVRGKIVLVEGGTHARAHELAVHRFGALGTVHFYEDSGQYLESEGIYWANINPWSQDGKKESTFGINISFSQGKFLKGLLADKRKVVVSVKIEAELIQDGNFELATAVIPGTEEPEEEFIFYAHLDHPKPGAHDNASGDATLLEIARTLASLIQKGIIPAPRRSIRFMWVPHMSGLNMYFFSHQEKLGKVKAGCNVDCVGANPARFPTQFHVALPPHSLPAYLTDITMNLVDYVNSLILQEKDMLFSPEGSRNLFSIALTPYQGSSDEYTANTRSMNIPSIYFYDDPLPPRHNQINFLEYLDRTNLNRVCYLGAIISYAFAATGEETAPGLMMEMEYRAKTRLERELAKARHLIECSSAEDIHRNYQKGTNLLFWGKERELGMLKSVDEIAMKRDHIRRVHEDVLKSTLQNSDECLKQLSRDYESKCLALETRPQKATAPAVDVISEKVIPSFNPDIKGSIGYFSNYLEDRLGQDFLKKYPGVRSSIKYGNVGYYEALNYIDGRNSVADIFRAVEAELWSGDYSSYHQLKFEEFVNFFRLLADAGVVAMKTQSL
jgi:aminopeptidase YwaD